MLRIEGRHPVLEALRARRIVRSIKIASGAGAKGSLAEILELAAHAHVRVEQVSRQELDDSATTGSHQGVIAEMDDFMYSPWQHAVESARSNGDKPFVLALDGITDPQNVGSLIRSAQIFGAHAVILPARRAASVTASVVKASAGAIWHIAVDQVVNVQRALTECQKLGLWVIAFDANAATPVSNCTILSEPCAIVVGAEGKGVSRLVLERADATVKINQTGTISSLGVSVAGAIALHEVQRAREAFPVTTQLS